MGPADSGVGQTRAAVTRLDAESTEWLRELAGSGSRQEAALARLHEMLLRIAHGEVRRRSPRLRITVNAVAPGPFESKMMAATLKTFGDAIADAAPLKRIGRPDDMAGVAIYLASRAGAYVTGAVIPVDGGIATTV